MLIQQMGMEAPPLKKVFQGLKRPPKGSLAPDLAILYMNVNLALANLASDKNPFLSSVMPDQYCRKADGSYAVSTEVVDVINGEKWLRTCGAVTNLLPSGVFSNGTVLEIIITDNNGYKELTKASVNNSRSSQIVLSDTTNRLTCVLTLRKGAGVDGNKASVGFYTTVWQPIVVSKLSGPGSIAGTSLAVVSNLSATEDTVVCVTLDAAMPVDGSFRIYPGGSSSSELGASILIRNPILTATAYPVPYAPPGTTMPASYATTTGGPWFALPQYDDAETSDGLWKRDGVELVANGSLSGTYVNGLAPEFSKVGNCVSTEFNQAQRLVAVSEAATNGIINAVAKNFSVVAGQSYMLTVSVTLNSGQLNAIALIKDNGSASSWFTPITTSGTHKIVVTPTWSGFSYIRIGSAFYTAFDAVIDNLSIQKLIPATKTNQVWAALTGGPMTLATRVMMGVGSGDFALGTPNRLDEISCQASNYGILLSERTSGNSAIPAESYDRTTLTTAGDRPWNCNAIITKFVQVKTDGTQYRAGYMIEGIHATIQWFAWTAFDGSFNPSTLFKLMLGYNNIYPMWFSKIIMYRAQIDDAKLIADMGA